MPCTGFALVLNSTLPVPAKTCELKQVTKPMARRVGVAGTLYLVLQRLETSTAEVRNSAKGKDGYSQHSAKAESVFLFFFLGTQFRFFHSSIFRLF